MKRSTQAGIAGGLLAIATAFGVAVIQRQSAGAELERRMALRSDSTALDLALRSRDRTQFVSAIERNDAAPEPGPRPSTRAPVRRQVRASPAVIRSPARVTAPVATEVATVESAAAASPQAEAAPVDAPAEAAPVPSRTPDHFPAPRPTPTRRNGGYWSTGDVIRNAPFPINP